jgi:hypothetical protein
MIRGRRVGILMGIFIAIPILSPLHPIDQKIMLQKSKVTLDATSYRNIAIVDIDVKNDTGPLPNETIQTYMSCAHEPIQFDEKKTDLKGSVKFTFVYKKKGSCEFYIVNTTYRHPFLMKSIAF